MNSRPKKDSIPTFLKSRENPACFFKIMLGDFRQHLNVPPKFACTIQGLVKQDVYLRDSEGHSTKVKLSVKENHLVFREGWDEFVLDHAIMPGEFLVFKYSGQAVFTVQIFGINACERVNFNVKSCSNVGGVKRKATELHKRNIHYSKRKKTFQASEYRLKLNKCDSHENLGKEKISSNGFVSTRFNQGNHTVHEEKKVLTSLERVHIYKSDTPPTPFKSEYAGQPSHVIDQDVTKGDAKRVLPTLKRAHTYKSGTPPTPFASDYSGPLVHKTEQDTMKDAPNRVSPVHLCEVPCNKVNKEEENNSHIVDLLYPNLLSTKDMLGDSLSRNHPLKQQRYEDDMKILIAMGEVICRFLLTEDGICHIYDEFLTKELGASILPDNDILIREKETRVSPEEKVVMPREPLLQRVDVSEVCCAEPMLNHTNLTEGERRNHRSNTAMATKQHQGKGKFVIPGLNDVPLIKNSQAARRGKPSIKFKEDPGHRQNYSCGIGRVANAFSNKSKEKATPFLKENIKVKLDRTDRMDLATPASAGFKFSFSLSAQTSWIVLPTRLPSRLCKLREERAVILLQDPSTRLWPVLYYEGFRFIGFIGGWEHFITVNNLKKGDICVFEVARGSQFTLQVHISRV